MFFDFEKNDAKCSSQRQQIKAWVTANLSDDVVGAQILVTELECSEPGCPPKETVIALLASGAPARQYKVFKPLGEITETDVVFALQASTPCDHQNPLTSESKTNDLGGDV